MKRLAFACLFFAATSVLAQNSSQPSLTPPPASDHSLTSQQKALIEASAQDFAKKFSVEQSPCPVRFTDVSLKTKGHMMLVHPENSPDGDLAFQYENQSGKTIQSIAVRVALKVKQNVYALDTTDLTIDMALTGKGLEETLPLNIRGQVYAVNHVTLERVSYTDGTTWAASAGNTCRYEKQRGAEEIGKLQ